MAGGTITFGANGPLQGKIDWSSSSNGPVANSSNVIAILYARRTDGYSTYGASWSGYVNANGAQNNISFASSVTVSSNWVEMARVSTTVKHNENGSKSITISGSVTGPSGTSLANRTSSDSQPVALDTIPRKLTSWGFTFPLEINRAVITWETGETCSEIKYGLSANNMTTQTVNSKSGTVTINNLEPNTKYTIFMNFKRADSGLYNDTNSSKTFTTLDIARLTSTPNINIGDSQKITWNKPNTTNCTLSLKLCKTDNNTIIDYGTVTNTTEKTVTPTASKIYALTPNSIKYTARYILTTTSNGKSYTNSKDFTFTVTNSNPTFTNFNYADTNNKTITLTGNNQILIKGYSNNSIMIEEQDRAIAKNSASMLSYKVVQGSKSDTKPYSGSSGVLMSISNVDSPTMIVSATDSRSLSTSIQKTAIFKNYSDVVIKSVNATRGNNGVGESVTLAFNGSFWNDNFGAVTNAIKSVTYQYKETSSNEWSNATALIPTITNSDFNGSISIQGDKGANGFSVEKSFNIRLTVTDELSTKIFDTILGSGTPAMAIYKDNVAIGQKYDTSKGGKLQVNGDIRANKLIGNLEGTADKVKINSRDTTNTWIPVVSAGNLNYTLRKKPNAVSHTNHPTDEDCLPTLNFLSFWNGAYNANGASNLKYCSGGEIQEKPKFSQSEQRLGTWIDGKTLYTKVLVKTNVTTTGRVFDVTIASGSNLASAWFVGGYAYYAGNGYQYPLDSNIGITIQVSATNNHLRIINDNGSGRTFDIYAIMYYTKK